MRKLLATLLMQVAAAGGQLIAPNRAGSLTLFCRRQPLRLSFENSLVQHPQPVLSFLSFCFSSYSASLSHLEASLTRFCPIC